MGGHAVIKDGDTLRMWYRTGYIGSHVGYAKSVNGVTWIKHPTPVELDQGPALDWDDFMIIPYTVIKEDNQYKMWYIGMRSGFPGLESLPQVGLATSPDGIVWTKYDDPETSEKPYASSDPVLHVGEPGEWDSHRSFDPMVLKTDTGYEMWYAGLVGPMTTNVLQQIGYATSDDGIHWTRDPDNPIYTDPTPWGRCIYGGSVVKHEESYNMWYSCFNTFTDLACPQIGYAVDALNTGLEFQPESPMQFFHIWPNPCSDALHLKYRISNTGYLISDIYSISGQRMKEIMNEKVMPGEYEMEINISDLPPGVYFCTLQSDDGIQTLKLIKL